MLPISPVAATCRAWEASSATVRARRRMSACWTGDRWRERILPAPRQASPQALTVACLAVTFVALSSGVSVAWPQPSKDLDCIDHERRRCEVVARSWPTAGTKRAILDATQGFQSLRLIFLPRETMSLGEGPESLSLLPRDLGDLPHDLERPLKAVRELCKIVRDDDPHVRAHVGPVVVGHPFDQRGRVGE